MQSQVQHVPLFENSTWAPSRQRLGLVCVITVFLVPEECPRQRYPGHLFWMTVTTQCGEASWQIRDTLTCSELVCEAWNSLIGPLCPLIYILSLNRKVKSPYFLFKTEDWDVGTDNQHLFSPKKCELLMSRCQHWAPHGPQWSSACHGLFLDAGVTAQHPRKAQDLQRLKLWFRRRFSGKLHIYQSFAQCFSQENKQLKVFKNIEKELTLIVGRTKENGTYGYSSLLDDRRRHS